MNEPILGFWHKMRSPCDYCVGKGSMRIYDNIYVVREGDCIGKFCSKTHFGLAQEEMKDKGKEE